MSIPSNIAEGKRRKRQLVYLNHLDIAFGSQGEVEVQLEIAKRVGFLASHDYDRIQAIVEEVGEVSGISCVGHSMRSVYAPQTERPDA